MGESGCRKHWTPAMEDSSYADAASSPPNMQSKNKPAPTKAEREHIVRIKSMPCVACGHPPPSECHEIEQGKWFLSLPVCPDCHRGSHNGPPGRGAIWRVKKMTELSALNDTLWSIFNP